VLNSGLFVGLYVAIRKRIPCGTWKTLQLLGLMMATWRGESLNDQDDARFNDRRRTTDEMHCSCALLQFLSTFHGRNTDVRAPYYDLTLSKRYIYPSRKLTKSEHVVESQHSHLVTIYGTLFIAHVTYIYVCMYVCMTTGVDYYQGVLSVYYADIPPWTTLTKYGNSLNVITKRDRLN
jgi:hypothetical protein